MKTREEVAAELNDARVFSVLDVDIRQSTWQIPVLKDVIRYQLST